MKSIKAIRFINILFFAVILILDSGCNGMITNVSGMRKNVVQEPVKETNVLDAGKEKKIDYTIIERNNYGYNNGDKYLKQYSSIHSVKQIVLVEQSKEVVSEGTLFLLIKNESGVWQEVLRCKAYLGKNGIDKTQEGDARTPTGDYGFLMAFGAKENPGSLIPYTKVTDTMYVCGDKGYYNQFVDTGKVKHHCGNNSEHLLSYVPQYNYALFIDYNKEGIYGKGSAIFLHCFGNYPFTMGCVSVSEKNMIKILMMVDENARVCIYAKG